NFVKDPMEVVKVGDVHEFTILNLDMDRRRISLSLKSDAASRAGTDEKSKVRGTAGGAGTGAGGKKVVVVKKGGVGASGAGARNGGDFKRDNGPRREKREWQGSDDGMMYNPFAALLKK
ncbi:MAG: S1 RNA-binding domain-containing protein, partial [Treponema sp.]|nr:S1 RNA-binding domain-containing protein [Treponema sp.]